MIDAAENWVDAANCLVLLLALSCRFASVDATKFQRGALQRPENCVGAMNRLTVCSYGSCDYKRRSWVQRTLKGEPL